MNKKKGKSGKEFNKTQTMHHVENRHASLLTQNFKNTQVMKNFSRNQRGR